VATLPPRPRAEACILLRGASALDTCATLSGREMKPSPRFHIFPPSRMNSHHRPKSTMATAVKTASIGQALGSQARSTLSGGAIVKWPKVGAHLKTLDHARHGSQSPRGYDPGPASPFSHARITITTENRGDLQNDARQVLPAALMTKCGEYRQVEAASPANGQVGRPANRCSSPLGRGRDVDAVRLMDVSVLTLG